MKLSFISIISLGFSAVGLFTGCGSPTHAELNPFDSTGITRSITPGLAHCNAASVSGILDADVEHPATNGVPDQNHLLMVIKTLSSNFMADPNNKIQFFRAKYSVDSSGAEQLFQDNSPLLVNLVASSNTSATEINPVTLANNGLSAPFYAILSGTDVPWEEIMILVTISGSQTVGQFLIPDFDADPMVYRSNHSAFPSLTKIHPFFSSMNQQQDYVSLANNFCF